MLQKYDRNRIFGNFGRNKLIRPKNDISAEYSAESAEILPKLLKITEIGSICRKPNFTDSAILSHRNRTEYSAENFAESSAEMMFGRTLMLLSYHFNCALRLFAISCLPQTMGEMLHLMVESMSTETMKM